MEAPSAVNALLLVWQHARIERGFWFSPARVAWPGRRRPLVSALMITKSRPALAAVAIACFQAQTWPRRELVIIDHGTGEDLARHVRTLGDRRIRHVHLRAPRLSIGTLRNHSVAAARGDWVCQWDDDDLSHPRRMELQMTAARLVNADACLLARETLWRPHLGQVAWSSCRHWEHSLVARRDVVPKFLPRRRGSDTPVVARLLQTRCVAALDAPGLYVHVGHGQNTWNDAHFEAMWRHATRRSTGRSAERWLQRLGKDLPVPALSRALGLPRTTGR